MRKWTDPLPFSFPLPAFRLYLSCLGQTQARLISGSLELIHRPMPKQEFMSRNIALRDALDIRMTYHVKWEKCIGLVPKRQQWCDGKVCGFLTVHRREDRSRQRQSIGTIACGPNSPSMWATLGLRLNKILTGVN